MLWVVIRIASPRRAILMSTHNICYYEDLTNSQGQLLEGVECHIYLYCFTFDDINLNRAFVIIVLFPKNITIRKCVQMIKKRGMH